MLPNGFKPFLIKNLSDLEILLMNNKYYCGVIAAALSARTKD